MRAPSTAEVVVTTPTPAGPVHLVAVACLTRPHDWTPQQAALLWTPAELAGYTGGRVTAR